MPAKKSKTSKKLAPKELVKSLKLAAKNEGATAWQKLASENISSPLMLIGEEPLRIKRSINWIKENFFKSAGQIATYTGQEISSASSAKPLINSLNNLSLFSEEQLVIIYDADNVKAATAKPIAEAIEKTAKENFVILVGQKINQRTPLLNALKDKACTAEFNPLQGAELQAWIKAEVKKQKASIEPPAVQILATCYGSDLMSLANEISKLSLLAEKEGVISKKMVQEVINKTPDHNSFELVNSIASKNVAASLHLTNQLISQGMHPLQVCHFLGRSIRALIGDSNENSWFANKLSQARRFFSKEDLINSLEIVKKLDLELKSSGLSDKSLLTVAVERMTLRSKAV